MNEIATGVSANRRAAFRAAGRHSLVVKWAKRGIVGFCAIAFLVLAGLSYFDPFKKLPKGFEAGATTFNGSRIMIEKPRLSGYREDGTPYDLRAASGVQDVRTPQIVDLSEIEANFQTSDQRVVRLSAPRGTFDGGKDMMTLAGEIRIASDSGYDIRLREANVNFRTGTMTSEQPFTVVMPGGAIAANHLLITENGKKISFLGGVETTLTPAAAPDGGE